MTDALRTQLIKVAEHEISAQDPTHDVLHAKRVLGLAENIGAELKADMDILVPAALFHDVIVYHKHGPNRNASATDSATRTAGILKQVAEFPQDKIPKVSEAIAGCSFKHPGPPAFVEAAILQDADWLEATGAVAIMRTFAYTGVISRPFYDEADPFAEKRTPDSSQNALDLFYERLLIVGKQLNTAPARRIEVQRSRFLKQFLEQLRHELGEDGQL